MQLKLPSWRPSEREPPPFSIEPRERYDRAHDVVVGSLDEEGQTGDRSGTGFRTRLRDLPGDLRFSGLRESSRFGRGGKRRLVVEAPVKHCFPPRLIALPTARGVRALKKGAQSDTHSINLLVVSKERSRELQQQHQRPAGKRGGKRGIDSGAPLYRSRLWRLCEAGTSTPTMPTRQPQRHETAIAVGSADEIGRIVIRSGQRFVKRHPAISAAWVLGLLVSILASGYTPTPAAVQNYEV